MNQKTAKLIRREINSLPIGKKQSYRHRYLFAKDLLKGSAKRGHLKKFGTMAMVKSIKAYLQ